MLIAAEIYFNERLAKSHVYLYTAVTPGVFSLFNVADKRTHSFKRRLVGQAVSERSMRLFEPTMLEQIDMFLQTLLASSKTPVNLSENVKRLGMDIVSLLGLGYPLHTLTDPTYRYLIDAHVFGNFRRNMFMQFPFLKVIKIYSLLEKFAVAVVRRYWAAIERMIAFRVAQDEHASHDLHSMIADQINPEGKYLKESEIWAEAVFFFPAGAETTATLICAALFYLSRRAAVYKKLAEEMRTTFQTSSEIRSGPKLAGCEYLRACIDECLRISPPGPGTLWREQSAADTSPEPIKIEGHIIPRGTMVGVNIYTLHHDERYFPEPFAYKPERWLASHSPEAQRKAMLEAFTPFSIGMRNCPGKAMAYQEASIVLAKIFWYFDFETAPGQDGELGGGNPKMGSGREREGEYQLYDIMASTHDGPKPVFKPRGDLWKELGDKEQSPAESVQDAL